ncbi:hypothetical protein [Acinetobacter bereziniae]|uniref:hypothetical protein n=1 Tax=Acinetobacter bereziniae TaxID=106648 RepID=UPI0012FD6498|nr:hypothetical protein [Acinetobacter bereziniae]
MFKNFLVSLLTILIAFLVCSCDQKTNANKKESAVSSTSSEEKIPTSKEIMEQFIKTFPELKPSDFPPLDSEESAFWWLMLWESDYEISSKYIARSDYKDWWSLIEKSINGLHIVQGKKIVLEPSLTKMYAKIEKLENDEDNSLALDDIYTAYYENVVNEVLKQNYDVIGLDIGEGANFILTKPNNPELQKLAKMLQLTYPESQVTAYQTIFYPDKYNFEFTADKLGK